MADETAAVAACLLSATGPPSLLQPSSPRIEGSRNLAAVVRPRKSLQCPWPKSCWKRDKELRHNSVGRRIARRKTSCYTTEQPMLTKIWKAWEGALPLSLRISTYYISPVDPKFHWCSLSFRANIDFLRLRQRRCWATKSSAALVGPQQRVRDTSSRSDIVLTVRRLLA